MSGPPPAGRPARISRTGTGFKLDGSGQDGECGVWLLGECLMLRAPHAATLLHFAAVYKFTCARRGILNQSKLQGLAKTKPRHRDRGALQSHTGKHVSHTHASLPYSSAQGHTGTQATRHILKAHIEQASCPPPGEATGHCHAARPPQTGRPDGASMLSRPRAGGGWRSWLLRPLTACPSLGPGLVAPKVEPMSRIKLGAMLSLL